MKLKPIMSRPNRKVAPDINDPNNYCKSCNITFVDQPKYRSHLVSIHKMNSLRRTKDKRILPKANDPNFYCKVCKLIYPDKEKYWSHLRNKHEMDPEAPYFDNPAEEGTENNDQQEANTDEIKKEQENNFSCDTQEENMDSIEDANEEQEEIYEDEEDFSIDNSTISNEERSQAYYEDGDNWSEASQVGIYYENNSNNAYDGNSLSQKVVMEEEEEYELEDSSNIRDGCNKDEMDDNSNIEDNSKKDATSENEQDISDIFDCEGSLSENEDDLP
jgi:hypothetical protein